VGSQAQGEKVFAAFLQNAGGLNLTDSPFLVQDGQAAGGYNYDYVATGGFQKSLSPQRMNPTPDSQLKTLGLGLRNTKKSTKSIIRAAGTKLQLTDLAGTFTPLTDDTIASSSDFLAAGSKQPVVNSMFVTPSTDILWMAGGGMASIYGAYSDSKVTANGTAVPTGAFTATETPGLAGVWLTKGKYYYAVAFRKASTSSISNAVLDLLYTVTDTTSSALLNFNGLTNADTTKYDRIELYRSTVNGASAFTAGDLVAEIDITSPTFTGFYLDTGSELATAQVVARAGNIVLDNSTLPAATYSTLCTWKRRLVTTTGSTVHISDVNKPESWPLTNTFDIPSGGAITGVAIISYTPNAVNTDEFLAIFKETEVWILTGSDYTNWALKFVDNCGTLGQTLIATASGYLFFIDNRGIYLWDGLGKPVYLSRPIESIFGTDGKLDRFKLSEGSATFFRRQNQVIWFLSQNDIGEQKLLIKLDLRLTLPSVKSGVGERYIDGVFLFGKTNDPCYAAASFIFPTASNQEQVLVTGDDAGYTYRQFYSTTGQGANDYDFTYETKNFDLGSPSLTKQFYTVVAWVENLGNWPLELDYWTDWRASEEDKNTTPVTINENTNGTVSLWDVAKWDVAKWDGYVSKPKRVVFNLTASPFNNNQGEVIKLRFRNQASDQPVKVYGFGIYYANLGTRT
jgi:hypothetical protein